LEDSSYPEKFARLERRLQALAAKNSAWQAVREKTRRKKSGPCPLFLLRAVR
jgi:hypothetical protein